MSLLPIVPLEFASHQEVEFLIRASQFDIGLQRHRIVSLHERIEKFMRSNLIATGLNPAFS